MNELKPKRALDKDLLRRAANYYRFEFNEEVYNFRQEWECFSHPSLELHDCNSRAKLPGRRNCDFCKHNVDIPCDISCDFQTFCLAVYACRLGIGGEDFDKALQKNLFKKTPNDLYDEVIMKLSGVDIETEEEDEVIEEELDVEVIEAREEKWYTVSEAAKKKGCSYPTIYNAITKHKLAFKNRDGRKMISESDLKAFKTNSQKGTSKRLPKKVKRKDKK